MDSGVVLRVTVTDDDGNVVHTELIECRSSAPKAVKAFNTKLIRRFASRFPEAHEIDISPKNESN